MTGKINFQTFEQDSAFEALYFLNISKLNFSAVLDPTSSFNVFVFNPNTPPPFCH